MDLHLDARGLSAKLGLDATVPLGEGDRFLVSRIPAIGRKPASTEIAANNKAFQDYVTR